MSMFNRFRSKKGDAKKILIVDDEPNILRTVADRLRMTGYEVVTAADGEEGLERALEEKPDLILLDILMPRLDGFATLDRLGQITETRDIPVIMLTARSQAEDVLRATASGAADYVVKPFDLVGLIEKIDKVLGGAKAGRPR